MKGQMSNCEECGSLFIKKREHHRFCKTSCRVANNRKKNGVAPPSFLQGVAINKQRPMPATTPSRQEPPKEYDFSMLNKFPVPVQKVQIRKADREILQLQNRRNYLLGVIEDAKKGVFPLATLGLGGLGFSVPESGAYKLLFSALGVWMGSEIDDSRAKNKRSKEKQVINSARLEIGKIDAKIRHLRKLNSRVDVLAKTGHLKPTENNKLKFNNDLIAADAYRKENIPSIKLGGKWSLLIGDPAPGFLMLLSGKPGNGKSTTAIEFAQYYETHHGKVMFVASEQPGLNKPLQSLLERFNATFMVWRKPVREVGVICDKIRGYDFVVIDSVNHMKLSPEDIAELRERNPKTSFLLVMQSTKDGSFKGSQEYLHDADIHVKMENFIANQTKSRFAAPMQVPMFD